MDRDQNDIKINENLVRQVINRSQSDLDEPDKLPRDLSISYWDLIAIVSSIVSHIIDVFIDFNVAYQYYIDKELIYFILTVIFIAVPSIINTFMSLKIYSFQGDIQQTTRKLLSNRLLLLFLPILQLAPVLRYYDVLKYALKSREAANKGNYEDQKHYYALMAKEDSYVSLLRIFECFLESVPQEILQIFIVLAKKKQGFSSFQIVNQSLSIASSTISIAWALTSYHKNVRIAFENRKNMGITGTILQFLWHIMITGSRILSISLAAIVWPTITGICCIAHWLIMTLWIYKYQNVTFCVPYIQSKERIMKFFFSTILGLVYIFTYLSPSEGQGNSRNRYLGYYGIFLIENISAVTIWAITGNDQNEWYYLLLMIASILSFFVGIMFMVIYYIFFHPRLTHKEDITKPCTNTVNVINCIEDLSE